LAQDAAASLVDVPDWAVEMQERREGKPYKGLLTTPLPWINQSIRDLSRKGAAAISKPQVSDRERKIAETVETPLRVLNEVGKAAGDIAQTVTGSPNAGTLVETGVNLAPTFLGRKGGKEIAEKAVDLASDVSKKVPERMYRSAVKPEKKLSVAENKALVDKGLDSRTLVSDGFQGVRKLERIIDNTTDEIDDIIDRASKRGDSVSTQPLLKRLEKVRDSYPSWRGDEAFNKMVEDIEKQGKQMPISEAQKLKRQLNHAYDKESSALLNEGEKALRHGILDEEIKLHPELKKLGQNEKTMIDLQKAINDRVKAQGKKDLIGLGNLLKIGMGIGGYVSGGHPGTMAVATFASMMVEHPTIKSALAIALNEARKVGTKGAKVAVGAIPPIPVIPGGIPQQGKPQKE
jgi:hypothetical protein